MDNKELNHAREVITSRKGALKAGDIPVEVLKLLNSGNIESVNLTEWLAVDHFKLLGGVLEELDLLEYKDKLLLRLENAQELPTMKVIPAIAEKWIELLRKLEDDKSGSILERLKTHRSDSVRCWAAYMIGLDSTELERKLELIRQFAGDHHFGVREIAWMAVRPSISRQIKEAIHMLSRWIEEEDANLRRFAVEATRPRGVWAKHIAELKDDPALGLPLLEPLKADSSKYVQDSVANWLNDAAKTQPDWVVGVCDRWQEESKEKATKRIATRAQRSMGSSGK